MPKSLDIYRVCLKYCTRLLVPLAIVFSCFPFSYAQIKSLVPPETIEQAIRIAQKIEQDNLVLNLPTSIEDKSLEGISDPRTSKSTAYYVHERGNVQE